MSDTYLLLFCAENFFADTQFPRHTIAGDEEPTGYEAWRVGVGRRYLGNRWQPTTANADHSISVKCATTVAGVSQPIPRMANFLAIDRASNHLGYRYQLQGSDDAFGTVHTVLDVTIPSVPGGLLTDASGCVTDEGAWYIVFIGAVHNDWRLVSKAMGAGLVPQLTGVYLGFAWQPPSPRFTGAMQDEQQAISMVERRAPSGWVGKDRPARSRRGQLEIFLPDETDLDLLRYQVLGLYAAGQPAWIMTQRTTRPWRGILARCPAGDLAWSRTMEDALVQTSRIALPFEEEQAIY